MCQKAVVAVENITSIPFTELRPGCGKAVLQEDALSQAGVFRVQPGSGVPTHLHSRVNDLFVGVKGELEIRYEGRCGNGLFVLRPGAFCSVPPGVRHEVSNPSRTEVAFFLLVHSPYDGLDSVPVAFRETRAVLRFSPRT
jgi:mannose-6-phosphate isomerase-like protein (cupin superfamily)